MRPWLCGRGVVERINILRKMRARFLTVGDGSYKRGDSQGEGDLCGAGMELEPPG